MPARSAGVFAIYVDDYAVDVPWSLFRAVHNPHLFREGLGVELAGGCRLMLYVDQTLGLAEILCDLAENYDFAADGLADFAAAHPEYAAGFRAALPDHLCFEDEYAAVRALYGTDFADVDPATMALPALYAAAALAGMKADVQPDGVAAHISPIRTPRYRGFRYGSFAASDHRWYHLYVAPGRMARFNFACTVIDEPPAPPKEDDIATVLASLRPHGSSAPGADMLTAAEMWLMRGRDQRALEIARCQVLCAVRYLGVRDEGVQRLIQAIRAREAGQPANANPTDD